MATKSNAPQSDAQPVVIESAAASAPAAAERPLSLGMQVNVVVAEGVVLINNETGARFAPGTPTPQTVTPTLLRRRDDGDLTIAP
ncbi:hypothetical protein [Variovorax sp. E3]|uniref:hypothetical protein n=1 Tax=Variovorax sp. E3 TaxID=1914993 RepID=UPI0018DD9AC7|nr:hypothetical protein [Variovorax sp. E3]